jgi:general secretion pathway protein I
MRRPSRGFTLVEVLVALAIVALSVGALLGAITSSASNVLYIKDKTIAEWVALNRLTEIRTWQQMPAKGNRTGKTDMAGVRWQWESEVTELPVKGMFRIDVHVRSTGESVDDEKKPPARSESQAEPESSTAGSDLDDVSWTTTVTGVVGTSTSDRRPPIAFQYAVATQPNGPGGPNNPGTPNAPGTGTPGNPSGKPGSPNNPPVSNPGLQER